jgi:hypothetical protein
MIGRHINKILDKSQHGDDHKTKITTLTHCLPLYSDMGGSILISKTGEFLRLDSDTGTVSALQEETWETIALVSLARDYPDLAELRRSRPENAVTCPDCSGTGRVTIAQVDLIGGKCASTGWIV